MFCSQWIRPCFLITLLALLWFHPQLAAADKIRISYTAPGPQHGILWLGDTAGLFKKNSLDLEIICMSGNISAPSLMSGEIQFGQMTNPELTKRAFVKYRKTKDEKKLEDVYQTLREVVKPKPYPNMESFKTIFKDVSDRVSAAKTADPREFVDVSFLRELDKSGYNDGLYRWELLDDVTGLFYL